MNSIKMADEIWYFEDAIDEADELLESLTEWKQNTNQEYAENSHLSTKDYLSITDNAIFKCLDVWYKNHLNLNPSKYKVAQRTFN